MGATKTAVWIYIVAVAAMSAQPARAEGQPTALDAEAAPTPPPEPALVDMRTGETATPAPAPWRFGVGLHLDLLVPAGNAGGPRFDLASLSPKGARSVTLAILAESRFFVLPEPVSDLGISFELGWYHYGQSASRTNVDDPDFGDFAYESSTHLFTALLGPVYRLGLSSRLGLPFEGYVMGGFAAQRVSATTSYTAGGTTVTDSPQRDFGWGYFLGAEAALALGPGSLTGGVRFTSVRTDLKFRGIYDDAYNQELGETGGTSVLVGYRFEF